MYKTYEMELAGRRLSVDIGRVGKQAGGCAFMHYGDTTVLCTATTSAAPRDGIDFFPLSVEYNEKYYSVGKMPGGFNKREGKPSENAILTSRVIDRPMRPLFPKDYRNDVTLEAVVMSVDPECRPELVAMIGASIAASISEIPFAGPCAATQVGLVDGQMIINPSQEQWDNGDLRLTVSSTADRIMMIEAGANEVPEADMIDYIYQADAVNKQLVAFINRIVEECGKPKRDYEHIYVPDEVMGALQMLIPQSEMEEAVFTDDKATREENVAVLSDRAKEAFADKPDWVEMVDAAIYKYEKQTVRKMILQDHRRPDGRALDQIRPLAAEVDLIPRVHGSAMFTRGQTQICDVVTLAPLSDAQRVEGLDPNITEKRYVHQYNFPSYSVGETRVSRGPGRREIGHGALAERALLPVLPPIEQFPYAIRAVSETFESNGSTSMASTCASCMALMAAGVPITAPVAGISCGLVTGRDDSEFVLLTDIQGLEDFFGDMDFKVTGTHKGITAIQMDIKIHGLTREIVEGAFKRCRDARLFIMDGVMHDAIAAPRESVGEYAPKIVYTHIDPEKIGDVVGQRGKTINEIIKRTGCQIDIEDDGSVSVCGLEQQGMDDALRMIQIITTDFEEGQVLEGTVISIKEFGAFIEFAPGKEGMVHISRITNHRIDHVEDELTLGDHVKVVCLGKDHLGRFSFSMKDVPKPGQKYVHRDEPQRRERGERDDRGGRGQGRDRRPRRDRGNRQDQ